MAAIDFAEDATQEQTSSLNPNHSAVEPASALRQPGLAIDAEWYRRLYHFVDTKSDGRGADVMPMLSFLVIGGSASVLNLFVVLLFDIFNHTHHYVIAYPVYIAIATEISLIYNFFLNDRYTFKALIDGRRTWLQRMLRFHGPAMVGFFLTLVLSTFFHHLMPHVTSIVPQSFAILIVTVVNFTMHRFWTYRPAASVA